MKPLYIVLAANFKTKRHSYALIRSGHYTETYGKLNLKRGNSLFRLKKRLATRAASTLCGSGLGEDRKMRIGKWRSGNRNRKVKIGNENLSRSDGTRADQKFGKFLEVRIEPGK